MWCEVGVLCDVDVRVMCMCVTRQWHVCIVFVACLVCNVYVGFESVGPHFSDLCAAHTCCRP